MEDRRILSTLCFFLFFVVFFLLGEASQWHAAWISVKVAIAAIFAIITNRWYSFCVWRWKISLRFLMVSWFHGFRRCRIEQSIRYSSKMARWKKTSSYEMLLALPCFAKVKCLSAGHWIWMVSGGLGTQDFPGSEILMDEKSRYPVILLMERIHHQLRLVVLYF